MPKPFYLFKLRILSLSQKRAHEIYSHTSILKLNIIKLKKKKKLQDTFCIIKKISKVKIVS